MKHARSSEKYHRLVSFKRALVVRAHMRKIKHIFLDEGLFYFLISPINEQFVVKVSLLSQTT